MEQWTVSLILSLNQPASDEIGYKLIGNDFCNVNFYIQQIIAPHSALLYQQELLMPLQTEEQLAPKDVTGTTM